MTKKSTALAIQDVNELEEMFADEGFDSLPRMDISCGNSKCCQEGEVPVGHFYLTEGDDYIDLGIELDAMVIAARSKAMAFEPKLRIVYDKNHAEYAKIVDESGEDYASFGPELLLFTEKGFVTYYLKSLTNKRRGKSIAKHMGGCVHLCVDKVSNDKYSWFSFKAKETAKTIELPENANDIVGEFKNADNVLPE